MSRKQLRAIEDAFVVPGPSGVAIRDRLKHLATEDEMVLRRVGEHLGCLASRDLKARCRDGLEHDSSTWAARKQGLTAESSSRWAGSITRAIHDQWALSRRCQLAYVNSLEAGVRTLRHRLSQPIGEKGTKRAPGGYRSKNEWFNKSRRLVILTHRLDVARAERETGAVHVVRGGRRLLDNRHNLRAAQLTEQRWRERWEASRWFLAADGESGKRFGNETIRVTPDGEVSIRLPAPLAHLANAGHGRYVLASKVQFQHRGAEWRDRTAANRAVAYRIHLDVGRGRWYLTASWTRPVVKTIPLETARADGMIGVDTNADHFAAYRLDRNGNPTGDPRRFFFDLSQTAAHRDAQIRHAISRLLHWAKRCGVKAIGIENLDFTAEKTREKHGRRKRFRQVISGMPTGKLKARLVSMAAEQGLSIVAVDPAYTSMWGDEHWRKPLTSRNRKMFRHDAASIAIGRRALGHPIRRRTAPPRTHQSDGCGLRTVQAGPGVRGREETRPPITERAHDARTRTGTSQRTRGTSASKTVRDARSSGTWVQSSFPDTD
ncbi:IS200/IS605 family element transposase accessory protein TnpB [Streptomyces acidiscabies]|uniref:IS200/IS605 family element transposase accessory protein TnpB n=1 Tax=Streptomyces acidiscabies TaxID=42234 RepID=A0AAP6B5W8_9ACTN|nr:IS200/IS605 family element transposase accessory protein TnpB [Streptomyces acidiscabies]MBP5940295.1 IS200/IS605 family element transposase accessory protein TnpB [Streptomyces sp. LBUM 1476]MBZ3911527.1 IS200/IS605 family element transposase accessory protein TnpB [Streptomyces acidiscabies]MDX2958751.1 IS200/IS605 family element transposase accessory protein TnpB [Streptomyces acidiscabies]MDX3018189.1 IS200/IS605 family element transposase accessory protein TnpB [Streptomyces acidiscabie